MTDARTLTQALGGRWYGTYGLARCPAHDDQMASLSIGSGHDGRPLLYCHAGCEFEDLRAQLREARLLNGQHSPEPTGPAEIAHCRAKEVAKAVQREHQAMRCWNEAVPVQGTLAETYLREARGITCTLPDSLRFNPACWHGATATRLPGLVSRIDGLPRLAVHRTYLRPDGSGKADVERTRPCWGRRAVARSERDAAAARSWSQKASRLRSACAAA